MKTVVDFLGTVIKEGQRGIRVHSYSHLKEFKKITIKEIDITREYCDYVGVITDGNTRIGWTYPERIIVQDSFKVKI